MSMRCFRVAAVRDEGMYWRGGLDDPVFPASQLGNSPAQIVNVRQYLRTPHIRAKLLAPRKFRHFCKPGW